MIRQTLCDAASLGKMEYGEEVAGDKTKTVLPLPSKIERA